MIVVYLKFYEAFQNFPKGHIKVAGRFYSNISNCVENHHIFYFRNGTNKFQNQLQLKTVIVIEKLSVRLYKSIRHISRFFT